MELAEKFIWFLSFVVKILMVFTSWFIKQRQNIQGIYFRKGYCFWQRIQ